MLREFQATLGDSGPGLVKELVELYLDDSADLVAEMRRAIADGDAKVLERAAHTLKGSSNAVGATELASLSSDLQSLAESGSVEEAGAMMLQLESEHQRVKEELEFGMEEVG